MEELMCLWRNPLLKKAVSMGIGGSVSPVRLNTSNTGKQREFERLFARHRVSVAFTEVDLDEIMADDVSVVVHKASSVEQGVLVEDTSLNVEGEEVGINVRWMLENLEVFKGKRAWHVVLIAQRVSPQRVNVFRGEVEGRIVAPRGEGGFGFDPVFLPMAGLQTLAEAKPDRLNARALAIANFVAGIVDCHRTPITEWEGEWQH